VKQRLSFKSGRDGVLPGGLLPHEVCFGLFLVVTWVRLVAVTGFLSGSSLLYLVFLMLNCAAIGLRARSDSPKTLRIAFLFYPVAMNVLFPNMRQAIPAINWGRMDAALQSIDSALVGTNLSLRLQPLAHPWLTELFSFCYFLFFPYLLFSLIYYFCSDLAVLRKFIIGLFTVYGLGFLGYSLVPASGPYLAMADQFSVPLTGYWFTRWNAAVVAQGSNGVDVFPSLHCAVSAFFLFFDRRHRPWRFRLYVVPCVGLWISTIYLRYHYLIDLICGFTLAALALYLARRGDPPASEPARTTATEAQTKT